MVTKEELVSGLRDIRKDSGMTVDDVLKYTKFKSAPSVTAIEHGKRDYTLNTLIRYLVALDCDLYIGEEKMETIQDVFHYADWLLDNDGRSGAKICKLAGISGTFVVNIHIKTDMRITTLIKFFDVYDLDFSIKKKSEDEL